jgi:DNA repair protein RecN (Recombination protein N)
MLSALSIRNIVLIEHCEITLGAGLCVLTGETGAGKSILLDALGLVLGNRAEARLVRFGKDQAVVSATFDVTGNKAAKAALEELGLEATDELLIRRTLSPDGKTRCFINDVAVSVAGLKTLGGTLIEINGQHDGRGLLDPATHRDMLDGYGQLEKPTKAVREAYAVWKQQRETLAETERAIEAAMREKEYLLHMHKELKQFAPVAGEEEQLSDARTRMMQNEKLAQTITDAQNELGAGKGAATMLSAAQRILARSAQGVGGRFDAAIEALEAAGLHLEEAETAIEALLRTSEYDPQKLEQAEERLFALRAMARKYNVTADALPALLDEVSGKLERLKQGEHQLGALQQALAKARGEYIGVADILSKARAKAAARLEKDVAGELGSLKMAATQFKVEQEALSEDRWGAGGVDAVQFQAATNKGAALAPLHKIASGGELSRFMLAMKVALASVKSTPTLIFDEIDTGTGGAVADAIGQRLARLGDSYQVLVVTHLPQVAARGHSHLRVMKEEKSGATFTSVESLNAKTRKEELARMLAGAEVTPEARKAAEKLLAG